MVRMRTLTAGFAGDLGTLIPLLVALSKTGQVSLSASLIFGGLYNIITGAMFGIPVSKKILPNLN